MSKVLEMETSLELLPTVNEPVVVIKASRRRWFVLATFIAFSVANSFQFVAYSIITNVVIRYYEISEESVDTTSLIYTGLYAVLILPTTYIVSKKGLRNALLLGGLGTALGTFIKIFSAHKDRFWIVIVGQSFLGASQVVISCLPARIASVWFKSEEISLACALGVVGTQLGVGLGFVLPPLIVKNSADVESIGKDLNVLCWALAVFMVLPTVALLFGIPENSDHPPNATESNRRNGADTNTESFWSSLKPLFQSTPFILHLIGYALSDGITNSFNTLLNQNVLDAFPNCQEDAGRMGMLMIFTGIVTSIVAGHILDRTHRYKETTVFIYFFLCISFVALIFALARRSKVLVYISAAFIGLFNNSYNVVAIEFAMELTYPSIESTTNGLLIMPSQLLSFVFTILFRKLHYVLGPSGNLGLQVGLLLLGCVLTASVRNDLRRQRVLNQSSCNQK